jgi:glycosyltransferase involved in cell wall biosynthesis
MKVVLVGLPYFARKIAGNLAEEDKINTYLAIDTSADVWQKIRFVWHIMSARVLYFIGGQTQRGKVLWLAILFNKKIVMHWVGTDVLMARKAHEAGVVDADLIRRTKHLCEVDWIQKELLEVGIQAEIAQIFCFTDKIPVPPPLPEKFSILSYMGKGREKFYGIDKLIDLARSFPDIPIRIAKISEYSEPLPPNIHLLGWVNDMAKEYRECVLFLRLPEHDGVSFSVLEALSYGRHVGFSYSFYGTNKAVERNELHTLVKSLSERHRAGLLDINVDGYKFISENYTRERVMRSLAGIITSEMWHSMEL